MSVVLQGADEQLVVRTPSQEKRARQKARRIACATSRVLAETRDPARAAAHLVADQMRRAKPGQASAIASAALWTEHPATVALAIEISGVQA